MSQSSGSGATRVAPPDPLLAEIGRQPGAIRGAAAAVAAQVESLRTIARDRPDGRIVLTGMGSSFDACHALVATLGLAGVAAHLVNAAELLHFGTSTLDARTTLVVVSQSGRSVEIEHLVERLAGRPDRPFVVAVTNGTANPLAGAADVPLDIRVGAELGPATMTFAATLVALDAIGRVLAGDGVDLERPVRSVVEQADAAATAIDRLLADREGLTETMTQWHDGRPTIVIVSRGAGRAASDMASLTLKEVAGVASESMVTADFRHGPLELVGADLAIAFLHLEPATDEIDAAFAAELAAGPSSVLVVGGGHGIRAPARCVELDPIGRSLAPAVAVVPFQLLARALALLDGRLPGEFRYASKVTTSE
jgi:glucosamine--fructose-6-phosphate aminotransferase (isomerizing)